MANFTKIKLSASTAGRPIVVAATGTSLTPLHATLLTETVKDEVWLYATNTSAQDVLISITIGTSSTLANSDVVFYGVVEAYAGNVLLVPGFMIEGNNQASVQANAGVANAINITGYVNRIS